MANVSDTIPAALQPQVDAAIAHYNARSADHFEVTGIVDAEESLGSAEPRKLQLVLCGGDLCQRQDFVVTSTSDGFDVTYDQEDGDTYSGSKGDQSELDPPPGARKQWLERVQQKHDFTVLLFYRGFW